MRALRAVLMTCCAGLLMSGCVVASPDTDTYRDAAATTLGTAVSEVATTQKLLTLLDDDKIMRPTVVTQLRYSEKSLSGVADDFGTLNPPRGTDSMQQKVGDLLTQAEDKLEEARIAVHRGETSQYPGIAKDLSSLSDQMERVETSAS